MPTNPKIEAILEQTRSAGVSDEVTLKRLQSKGIDTAGYTPSFGGNSPVAEAAPQKSFSEKLGNTLGNIFGGKVIGEWLGTKIAENSPEAQALKNAPAITHQGKEIVPAGDPNKKLFEGPSGKEITGDLFTIALNFVPLVGKGKAVMAGAKTVVGQGAKKFVESAGKKLAVNAAFGAAQGASRAAADDEDVIKGAVQGGTTFAAISVLGSMVKGALANDGTKRLASKMYEWGLGLSKKNLDNEAKLGHKKAAFLIDKIGGGTMSQQKTKITEAYKIAETELQDTLKKSKIKFNTDQVRSKIASAIQKQFKNTLTPKQVQEIVDGMPLSKLSTKKTLTIAGLNEMRREFSENFLSDNNWLAQTLPQNKKAFRIAASTMSEIVKKTEKSGTVRRLLGEESAYITALDGIRQIESRTYGPLNTAAKLFGPAVGGGLGFSAGGPAGAVIGAGMEQLVTSTFGRTYGAAGLQKLAQLAQSLPESEKAQLFSLLGKLGSTEAAGAE